MPFRGDSPYGTDSDTDDLLLPQSPDDVRIAVNGTHVAYLLVNGPISVRLRQQIENVVRILNRRGLDQGELVAVAILIRENGAVVETDANDIDFTDGIVAESVSPNVVVIKIPNNAITLDMLTTAVVDALTTIDDGSITPAKLDRTYSEPGHTHVPDDGFAYTHTLTLARAAKTNPAIDAPTIATIPINTRVALSDENHSIGGVDWRNAYIEGWGFGWFTYSAGGFTAI